MVAEPRRRRFLGIPVREPSAPEFPDWLPNAVEHPDLVDLVEARPIQGPQTWKWVQWPIPEFVPSRSIFRRRHFDTLYLLHTPVGPVAKYQPPDRERPDYAATTCGAYAFSRRGNPWRVTMQTAKGRTDVATFQRTVLGASGAIEIRLGTLHHLERRQSGGFRDHSERFRMDFRRDRRRPGFDVGIHDPDTLMTPEQLVALCVFGLRLCIDDDARTAE